MEGNKFQLIPGVIVLSWVAFGTFAGTEYVAWKLLFDEQLGEPVWRMFGFGLYAPWKLFEWDYFYGAYAREDFYIGYILVVLGMFVGLVAAVILSVVRSRKKAVLTTHGSARFADKHDLKSSGLQGRGVMLGQDRKGRFLRHDGPEHVIVIAPTRSGKGSTLASDISMI